MYQICNTLSEICSAPRTVGSCCVGLADVLCPASSAVCQKRFTASINELSPTVGDQMEEDRKSKRLGRRKRYKEIKGVQQRREMTR